MKLLGNLIRDINLLQKRRLYRCCTLPIALYVLPLWYYNKAPTYYHLNILRKIQQRAILWITDVFCISPTLRVKAISRLVPIHLSQIRYLLVVILELNGVSEVQYKDVMMIDDGKYQ